MADEISFKNDALALDRKEASAQLQRYWGISGTLSDLPGEYEDRKSTRLNSSH